MMGPGQLSCLWRLGHWSRTWLQLHSRSRFCTVAPGSLPTLSEKVDRYNGVSLDLDQLPPSTSDAQFRAYLQAAVGRWQQEERTAAWLHVSIEHSRLLAVAADLGFTFHHAEERRALLKYWMRSSHPEQIPRFATHQMGVSGLVINEEKGEVLVVQDKNRPYQLWKFPGGLSDLGENIGETAVREVFEETGVRSEFASVLAFRQQHNHPMAFGRSDLYVLCRLRPLTFDLNPCEREIHRCQWMDLHQLKREVESSSLTRRLADMALYGLQHGFHTVDITSEEMKSVYKGHHFTLFHRPVPPDVFWEKDEE